MTSGVEPVRRRATAPAGLRSGASALALLEPALAEAAGGGAAPMSLALDLAHPVATVALGDDVLSVTAWLERSTRTLAFVAGEVRTADGRLVAAGSAVFKRDETAP